MKSFSKWRYDRTLGNGIQPMYNHDYSTNYEICFYDNPKEMKFIFNKIGRVMIRINHNKYITVCFTKKYIFRPFIWDWFYNIKKEINYINKYKDIFMKYWYSDDEIYNTYISDMIHNMNLHGISLDKAYLIEKDHGGMYYGDEI